MSTKRPLTPPTSTGIQTSEPSSKAARTLLPAEAVSVTRPLLCTLAPTCNPPTNRATPLANTKELEAHYATYHAHVCAEPGCKCVFPEERLLELHQTECHDPIAAVRKDRGEKIFACHLASCNRLFSTPKTRRLHLIQVHGYPKEYFFAVTNKGVGGLLKKWGEGASMVRGQWKGRDHADKGEDDDEDEDGYDDEEDNTKRALKPTLTHTPYDQNDTKSTTNSTRVGNSNGAAIPIPSSTGSRATTTAAVNRAITPASETKSWMGDAPLIEEDSDEDVATTARKNDQRADDLAGVMSSLSLVPSTVRLGRGASRGGRRGAGHRRKESRESDSAHAMDVDQSHSYLPANGTPAAAAAARPTSEVPAASSTSMGGGNGGYSGNSNGMSVPSSPARRPPMPPRGLGRGARGRFPGRARILLAGRGKGM